VSDPILDFRSDPFSDLQDFTSYAPGLTSLFRCIHPTQRKKIVALQVKRSIDFAADSPFFQFVTPELLLLISKFLANL
jgi:hypothetical protein